MMTAKEIVDELPESKGRKLKPIVEECGIFCELQHSNEQGGGR
jgi:hypothetical protein